MSDLDLSPILYPELFTEQEQAQAQASLSQDPEAQAELERLLLVRATLEGLGSQRASHFAERNPLSDAQREAILHEARLASQERATQASTLERSSSLWSLLFSPQLAWVGVLSLALISLWKLQGSEMNELALAPVHVEPLSAPSATKQDAQPARRSRAQTSAPSADTPALVAESPSLEQLEPSPIPAESSMIAEEGLDEIADVAPVPTLKVSPPPKPIKSSGARRQRAKSNIGKSAPALNRPTVRKRKAKPRAKPRAKPPAKGAKRRSKKKMTPLRSRRSQRSTRRDEGRVKREGTQAESQVQADDSLDLELSDSRSTKGASVADSMALSAPPPPTEPAPEPHSEREANQVTPSSSAPKRRYAPAPPQGEERSALDKSFPDSAQGATAQKPNATSPWADALSAHAKGQAQEALKLLERWLTQHMSHVRAREAAKLGTRWATELNDQRAQRRFIAYDRALSGGSSPSKSSARPKRVRANDSLMEAPEPTPVPSVDPPPSSLGF